MNAPESISHEQACLLLPWLLNDSLQQDEREAVREHARNCVSCRRELDQLQLLQESINRSAATAPQPDMRNINRRIDALIEKQGRGRMMLERLRDYFASPWRTVFVAQTAALLLIAAVMIWPQSREADYRTLTQAPAIQGGDLLRAVFSPELSDAGLSQLLDELQLAVLDGPSSRGVYTLGPRPGILSWDQNAVLESLQQNSLVLFAQPIVNRDD